MNELFSPFGTDAKTIRILCVEDDEDDFVLIRDALSDFKHITFQLEWVRTFEEGLLAILSNAHDLCMLDYQLGAHTGVELLRRARAGGSRVPILLLTGMNER